MICWDHQIWCVGTYHGKHACLGLCVGHLDLGSQNFCVASSNGKHPWNPLWVTLTHLKITEVTFMNSS